jgi:hypothetical protein
MDPDDSPDDTQIRAELLQIVKGFTERGVDSEVVLQALLTVGTSVGIALIGRSQMAEFFEALAEDLRGSSSREIKH